MFVVLFMCRCNINFFAGKEVSSNEASLHHTLRCYPELIRHAFSVDFYRPWSFEEYSSVAHFWLEERQSLVCIIRGNMCISVLQASSAYVPLNIRFFEIAPFHFN